MADLIFKSALNWQKDDKGEKLPFRPALMARIVKVLVPFERTCPVSELLLIVILISYYLLIAHSDKKSDIYRQGVCLEQNFGSRLRG